MQSITHRELRNNSAEVLRRVEAGESLHVTNNGVPAAMIVPVGGTVLEGLVARGEARAATREVEVFKAARRRLAAKGAPSKPTSETLEDSRGQW
ncbi:MAG: type II toxin-antitoxin system Phd/YefM family antitoxin [Pseudoclavibacter sp.]